MSKNKLPVLGEKSFEDLKHLNQFHDAGYKGLYGGLGNEAIKSAKAFPPKSN